MCVVKCCKDKNIDLLFIGEREKKHYFLIKDLTHSCMITHYIAEKKFVVIVYKLFEQKTYQNATLKIVSKLIVNKRLRCQKVNT